MNAPEILLHYLQHQIPTYPFDLKVDTEFVRELLDDFGHLDLLEETKTFRWYYSNQPVQRLPNVRVGLRRWLANARAPKNG
jgi:hypothetical protein